jgi:hypothetical protein
LVVHEGAPGGRAGWESNARIGKGKRRHDEESKGRMKQGRQRIDEEGKGRKRKGQQMKDEDQPKKHIQT